MKTNLISKTLGKFSFNLIHLEPETTTGEVIIIFPGAGYSHLGPILYYPTQWMLENNKIVIIADYDFRFFNEDSQLTRVDVLNFCVKECLAFACEKYPHAKFSFLGKSIGTQALCLLPKVALKYSFKVDDAKYIWLTPLWKKEEYLEHMARFQNKSLYVIGDKDSHYSVSSLQKITANPNATVAVIAGGDHSLDNNLSIEETFKIHREVFDHISNFIGKANSNESNLFYREKAH